MSLRSADAEFLFWRFCFIITYSIFLFDTRAFDALKILKAYTKQNDDVKKKLNRSMPNFFVVKILKQEKTRVLEIFGALW